MNKDNYNIDTMNFEISYHGTMDRDRCSAETIMYFKIDIPSEQQSSGQIII